MSMIHGMRTRRALAVRSRRSALHVGGRRARARGMDGAWRPLTLRWRRRRGCATRRRMCSVAASVSARWLLNIHLYFTLGTGERTVRAGTVSARSHAPARARAGTIVHRARPENKRVRRIGIPHPGIGALWVAVARDASGHGRAETFHRLIIDRLSPARQFARHVVAPRERHRAPGVVVARGTTMVRRVETRSWLPRSTSSPVSTPSPMKVQMRASPLDSARPRVDGRVARAGGGPAVSPRTEHISVRPLPRRSIVLAHRVVPPNAPPSGPASPMPFARKMELVWRAAQGSSPRPVHEVPPYGTAPRAHRDLAEPGSRDSGKPAPSPFTERAPLEVTHLAPSLVERLADDVIRRLEKGARIDRERRGL